MSKRLIVAMCVVAMAVAMGSSNAWAVQFRTTCAISGDEIPATGPTIPFHTASITLGHWTSATTLRIDSGSLTVNAEGIICSYTVDTTQTSTSVFNSDGTSATVTSASSTECPAYQITTPGGGYVQLHVTVTDGEAHLYQYAIQTQYGSGSYLPATPSDRDYGQAPASFTPPSPPTQLYGVDPGYQTPDHLPLPPPPPASPAPSPTAWTYVGGGDTIYLQITQSCCYDFQLWAGKRVTDGETFFCTYGNVAFQTVNIVVAS